jgi:hypothetical protein
VPAGGSGIANADGLLQSGQRDLQRLAVVVEQRVAMLPSPHMPFVQTHERPSAHAYPVVHARTPSDFAIRIDGLTKRFGRVVAR